MPYADGRLRPDETFVNDRFGGRIYVDVGQTTHSRIFPEGDFKDAIVRDQAARQAFAQGRFDQITQHDGGGSTQRPTTPTRSGHGTGRSAVDLAVAHTGHLPIVETSHVIRSIEAAGGRAIFAKNSLCVKALEQTGGNVTHTARLLKISRKSLQTKMKELGLRDD